MFDRQLTSIAVTGEITVDHAIRDNGSVSQGCGCDCFSNGPFFGTGSVRYGYQPQGSITDPDFLFPGDPCYPGCVRGECPGCATTSVSVATDTVICEQDAPGVAAWSSRVRSFSENFIGSWSWNASRVPYCIQPSSGFRIRRYCPFALLGTPFSLLDGYQNVLVDPAGAFIDMDTGAYVSTPHGETLGTLHAVQYARVAHVPFIADGAPCDYRIIMGIGFQFTWHILRDLRQSGVALIPSGYEAPYRKPCILPSDTVLGTYGLEYLPEYDRRFEDQECGPIRYFDDLRVSFPQTIEVS